MVERVNCLFEHFRIPGPSRDRGEMLARRAAVLGEGMTHLEDYRALAAIALHHQPTSIFEIGTFLGVTSNFFLELLPECRVTSIAYVKNRWNPFRKRYNNCGLSRKDVGRMVAIDHRPRFTQLFGDSHALRAEDMVTRFGEFDMVFIDGDHSRAGVALDTELCLRILSPGGALCWHDANPCEKYLDVREFLERDFPLPLIATADTYVGGVAYCAIHRPAAGTQPIAA